MITKRHVAISAVVVSVVLSVPLLMGVANGAASGKVIGMTSGGGSKGGVAFRPGISGHRAHQVLTISSPVSNVQCSGLGTTLCPSGGTFTATLTSNNVSCSSFMSGPTTWTGTAEVTWSSGTGVAEPPLTFSKYSITFGPGILYGTGKATVSGDGIKDGDETDIDALGVPTGFSCSTPAVDLTSATIETVLEMRKSG